MRIPGKKESADPAPPMSGRRRRRAVRKRIEAVLTRALFGLIVPLPRFAVRALARALGTLAFWTTGSLRRVAEANLDVVFGSARSRADGRKLIRAAYRNMALTALDTIWFSARPEERILRWIRFPENTRGMGPSLSGLLVTAHLGNWEILGQATSLWGVPLHSVAAPLKNPEADRLLNRARQTTGQRILPRDGALRGMLRALRRREAVGLLLDQNTLLEEGGEFFDFFGLPATVSPVAGWLAARCGAEIRFGFCLPCPDGSYRVDLPPGFTVPAAGPKDDPERIQRETTDRILRVYEQSIRANPECWLWMYKRWKHIRPGDRPDRYPPYSSPPRIPRRP